MDLSKEYLKTLPERYTWDTLEAVLSESDFKELCLDRFLGSFKYVVNEDGTLTPKGDITIKGFPYEKLPFVFTDTEWHFEIVKCPNLKTLEGCPSRARGFICKRCPSLKNLKGGPIEVEFEYSCMYLNITSLEGAPKKVPEQFICDGCNNLLTLEGGPIIADNYSCEGCKNLQSLKGIAASLDVLSISKCKSLKSLEYLPKQIRVVYSQNNNFSKEDIEAVCDTKIVIY